jgi:RNA polymerase sigma factor (TIGR02999 family)
VIGGELVAEDRRHLLAIAARAMRQVLVDQARRRNAIKRGSGVVEVRVTNADAGLDIDFAELLALDDALERLGQKNPRLPRVIELRFFAGLTEEETAATLGVTTRTVQRDWTIARAWLHKELAAASDP